MVHNCAILSCPLHNRRNIRKGLLFHSFPVDQHRFELWRQIVLRHCSKTISINKHSKICHRHFHNHDYIANNTGLTRYLKATAVPTIFPETNSTTNMLHSYNDSTTLNSHAFASSIDPNGTDQSSSAILLPPHPTSSTTLPTITNTKAKRLLSTIDKLHQIQSSNKIASAQKTLLPLPTSSSFEKPQINEDETIIDTEQSKTSHNDIPSDDSMVITQQQTDSFAVDCQSLTTEQPPCESKKPELFVETDARRWTEDLIPLPKNHLEDTLFKFLEQANLLQYYPAFIEQGGDDLKQLAEAQNEDFQEIITLVGMITKPLHVKRFQKALANYRQQTDETTTASGIRRLSTGEMLPDRHCLSSLIHSSTTMGLSPKSSNPNSPSWCLDKSDNSKNNALLLLDDNQRKRIADEAERLANVLPVIGCRKSNGRNDLSKDLFTIINLPRDFEDRWQRIRKYSAIYNRFDSKNPNRLLSRHEILINEAAAAICFHRPEFLTRREELLHLARRVLQNAGISNISTQKRSLRPSTCEIPPTKHLKLTIPVSRPVTHPTVRQRDPDAFRLMWNNREAKIEQIPIEIETLRCEQNKLLQQLKQNTLDATTSSSLDDNSELKKRIDDLGKKIEQLSDEERNLRRLIRKKNMRLRAKERQQQKQSLAMRESLLLVKSNTPSPLSKPDSQENTYRVKNEKVMPINLSSPVLKTRKELSTTAFLAKSIDGRRNEVDDRSAFINKRIILPARRTIRSTQKKQSSPMGDSVDLLIDSDFHSLTSNDPSLMTNNNDELIDSKNFIQQLDLSVTPEVE